MTQTLTMVAVGLALASAAACVPLPSPPITTLQTPPASQIEPLAPGEAMAVMAHDEEADWTTAFLRDELAGHLQGCRVLGAQEARDMLFPWLEPRLAPSDDAGLAALLAQPAVAERLRQERLRYLVIVSHADSNTVDGVELLAAGFSFGQQHDETTATILDVRSARVLDGGSARADAVVGHAHVGYYGVIAFSRTERAACRELGDALLKELADDAGPNLRPAARE